MNPKRTLCTKGQTNDDKLKEDTEQKYRTWIKRGP